MSIKDLDVCKSSFFYYFLFHLTKPIKSHAMALGAGTFSICKRGFHKASGQQVAIKIINKLKRNPEDEIDILFRYGAHPNILSLFEVFDDGNECYLGRNISKI